MSPHLVHVFSTFGPGGPQRRTVDVIHSLPAGWRHTILATNHELSCRERFRPGAPVAFEPVERPPGRGVDRRALGAQLRRLRPDLLLTYNWGATDALFVARHGDIAPMAHAEDGFGPDESGRQLARRVWARRWLLRRARAVVVPSRNLERIARELWWVPEGKVRYVANGIDVARYAPAEAPAAPGPFVIGSVAHLRGEKNPMRLVRAFARAAPPGSRLDLIGDGPERAALEEEARALGIADRVRFPGYLADPLAAYRAMDVVALSSDTEQMPLSVLEAMGCAKPVLSTDVGDVRSMVAPANAPFVTPLGDDDAYAAALAALAADAALRRRIGEANRARCVAEFSLERQNRAYLELYESLLAPQV